VPFTHFHRQVARVGLLLEQQQGLERHVRLEAAAGGASAARDRERLEHGDCLVARGGRVDVRVVGAHGDGLGGEKRLHAPLPVTLEAEERQRARRGVAREGDDAAPTTA
jgi:hypothetical protein